MTVAAGPGMSTHHGGAGTPPFPATPPAASHAPIAGGPVKSVGGMTGFGQGLGGQPFGPRYHLVRLLGAGGMGAVYQAWDQELGVVVAIKVIKPEAMENPEAARELERRFKRELLLARNVTHKNVVRIHDLGEVEGVKYITMPYVHGSDLGTIIKREHKVPLSRALAIAKQIAAGLVAAHDAGVVHRDLKPANILLDENDHALITDFGIARSTTGTAGGTVVGSVVGTLDYMAPEQARGHTVDHRADIYAFGLILSDMLIGRRQTGHGGESSLAALMTRMTTIMPPLRSVDPTIPQTVSDVVSRCTALDPEHRYAKTKELLKDLESLDDHGHPLDGSVATATHAWTQPLPAQTMPGQTMPGQMYPGQTMPGQTMPGYTLPGQTVPGTGVSTTDGRTGRRPWVWGAGAVALVALLGGGAWLIRDRIAQSGAPATVVTKPIAIVILPFQNRSGDPSYDALGPTIAEQLRTEIGQTNSVRAASATQVAQLLSDLRITPDANLDPATTGKIAEHTNSDVVISGQYGLFGQQIQITANLQDVANQKSTPIVQQAENRTALLKAISQLAASLREKLTLPPDALKALAASSYRPTSTSLEALQRYNDGLRLMREGKQLEAQKAFEAATQHDKDFALAFARLAQAYAALGFAPEAERHARTGVTQSGALPEVERFLVRAINARVLKNRAEAVEFSEKLAKLLPGSDEILADLASAYEDNSDFEKAHASYKKLVDNDPKNIDALLGLGRSELKRGQAQQALDPLNRAWTVAVERNNDEAKATAREWIGVTYRVLNNSDEALSNFKQALEIARKIDRKRMVAEIIHEMGKVQKDLGNFDLAAKDYQEALGIREEIKDRQGIGDTLNDIGNLYMFRGQYDRALSAYKDSLTIQREQGNESYAAMLLSNIGVIHFLRAENQDALTYYEQALSIREKFGNPADLADTVFNIGDTYVRLGRYREAEASYLRALDFERKSGDQRGQAQVTSSMGTLFGYQGRLDAALSKAKEAFAAIQQAKERDTTTLLIWAGYGNALASLGNADARKVLADASALARELKDDLWLSIVSNYQGDQLYYQGDFKAARQMYAQALQAATRRNDPFTKVWSRAGMAMATLKDQPVGSLASTVAKLVDEADRVGLKYQSVALAVAFGEALVSAKQFAPARMHLENALAASDKLGLAVQQARSHYWLSKALSGAGDASAAEQHLQQARRQLDLIRTEAKADGVLKRSDLAPIAAK